MKVPPHTCPLRHTSCKEQIVKFDEYKLLNNQIDRLTEGLNGMNIRPQSRQNQQSRPYKPYIVEAEVTVFLVMTEAEEIIDKGHMTGKEEYFVRDTNP